MREEIYTFKSSDGRLLYTICGGVESYGPVERKECDSNSWDTCIVKMACAGVRSLYWLVVCGGILARRTFKEYIPFSIDVGHFLPRTESGMSSFLILNWP